MNTDVPRILISHAASYWLGLVKVLCDNKALKIKRQVASVDKKSDFRSESGLSAKVHPIQEAAPRRNSIHLRPYHQVQAIGCIVSRMPKYKEGNQPASPQVAGMSTSVTRSSTPNKSHLSHLKRSRRHQKWVIRPL